MKNDNKHTQRVKENKRNNNKIIKIKLKTVFMTKMSKKCD